VFSASGKLAYFTQSRERLPAEAGVRLGSSLWRRVSHEIRAGDIENKYVAALVGAYLEDIDATQIIFVQARDDDQYGGAGARCFLEFPPRGESDPAWLLRGSFGGGS
jgi:hypothetical protein